MNGKNFETGKICFRTFRNKILNLNSYLQSQINNLLGPRAVVTRGKRWQHNLDTQQNHIYKMF